MGLVRTFVVCICELPFELYVLGRCGRRSSAAMAWIPYGVEVGWRSVNGGWIYPQRVDKADNILNKVDAGNVRWVWVVT